jgi:hypothetical protein
MPVEHGTQSEYAKEMRKWEGQHSPWGAPGRPYQFQEFPKRLVKASRVDGKIQIVDAQNAGDAMEELNLKSRGFYNGPAEAFAAIEKEQLVHGELAAEREYEIRHGRVSEKAAAEIRAVEAQSSVHVPEIPRTPIKRHRRTKAEMVADAAKG